MTQRVLGNIFAREGDIPPGGKVDGHAHNFDHVTACFGGRMKVEGTDPNTGTHYETTLEIGSLCLIRADIEHTLTQLPGAPAIVANALADLRDRMTKMVPALAAEIGAAHDASLAAFNDVPAKYACIYAHRTPQGDVVLDYDSGWPGAYATSSMLNG